MKTTTKLLSVFLALVMLFSMAMPSFAAINSNVTTVDKLVATDSLCGIVEWLLANLNARKEKFVPTVLTFVERYVAEIAAFIPAGKTVDTLTDEEKAAVLLNYLDKLLADMEINTADINNITSVFKITVDLTSVDGALKTLVSAGDIASSALVLRTTIGDVKDLNTSALEGLQRKGGDLNVLYGLFAFLKDNTPLLKKVIKGELNLGEGSVSIQNFFNPNEKGAFLKNPDGTDVAGGLNGSMKYLPTYIKNMIYDGVIDEPEMIAKVDRSWTIDEILGYAFLNLITKKTDITKAEASEVMTSSAYANLLKYAPVLYANFAVEPLNGSFKGVLNDLGESNANFKAIITTDYTFTTEDFNNLGLTADTGVLGGFNNMVYVVLEKILTDEAFQALAFEKGTTAEKLNSNLTKLCRYLLPMLGKIDEFDFSKFTADVVSEMSLEDMAVQVLKIFYPGWFHIKDDATMLAFVDSIDTMPEMLAAAAYLGFPEDNYECRDAYTTQLMSADKKSVNSKLTEEACIELALNILMDKAVYELDYAKANTLFVLSAEQVKAYKAAGWNWKDFADEIVDWALNMIKGVPAVADTLTCERGVTDGYGAFNKLNAVVNEIINFNFMSNVSSTTPDGKVMSVIDFETFILDGIVGNICDFDLAGILGLFEVNKKAGNILGTNFTASVIGIVNKALDAVFTHTCSNASYTVNPTCVDAGEKVSYCANNGHITKIDALAATGIHTSDAGKTTKNETCTTTGEKIYTCTVCNNVIKTEVIPALGHYFRSDEPYKDENGNTLQKETCSRCQVSNIKTIAVAKPESKTPTKITAANKSTTITEKTVEGFYVGTTASQLKKSFNEEEYIVIKKADGTVLKDTDAVSTGDIVALVVDKKEVTSITASILGDVDGDGAISASDARLTLRQSVKLEQLGEASLLAADVDGSEDITAADARAVLRKSVNLEDFSRKF